MTTAVILHVIIYFISYAYAYVYASSPPLSQYDTGPAAPGKVHELGGIAREGQRRLKDLVVRFFHPRELSSPLLFVPASCNQK